MTDSSDAGSLGADLTANSLAFLRRAVDQMASAGDDTQELAFAVVDLAVAVEVLLKAYVAHEPDGWREIFIHPDRPAAELLSGDENTIKLGALAALVSDRGVDTVKGKIDRADKLAKTRNRVVHFAPVSNSALALQSQLVGAMDFVLWFLGDQFLDHESDATRSLVRETLDQLPGKLSGITALVGERMASLSTELDAAETVLECPRCSQPALVLGSDDDSTMCLFCLWKAASGKEAAEEYAASVLNLSQYEAIKEGGNWPVAYCDICGEWSLVEGALKMSAFAPGSGSPSTQAIWACFVCGVTSPEAELAHCVRCGEVTSGPNDESESVCRSCWSNLLAD